MPNVDRTATISQIIGKNAATTQVFRKYDIDFCCRGDATVAEACRERRLRLEVVLADIERAFDSPAERPDAPDAPPRSLVQELTERHAAERRALPYIASLLPKIAGRYRHRDGRLDVLCDAGQDLFETLEAYLDEEERTLLPAVANGGCDVVRSELDRHGWELEVLLSHLRALTDGYVAPDWGDHAYCALMEELQALERDIKERLRIEEQRFTEHGGEPADPASIRARAARRRAPAQRVSAVDE